MNLQKARLGRSDLYVTRLGFGCEQLGGVDWGDYPVEDVTRAVRRAVDSGINFFDTADAYGLGLSEERLCSALGDDRHHVVIATKGGIGWQRSSGGGRAPTWRDTTAAHLERAIRGSLRRLRLERIPLYLVHWPDGKTEPEETAAFLARSIKAGTIAHVGLSNPSGEYLLRFQALCPVAAVEMPYNLLQRDVETTILPLCVRLGIGLVAYGPLAQGLLSGKYRVGAPFAENDRRHRLPLFGGRDGRPVREMLARLSSLAHGLGLSAAQVALGWLLQNAEVASAVAGFKNTAQLEEALDMLNRYRTVPAAHWAALPRLGRGE